MAGWSASDKAHVRADGIGRNGVPRSLSLEDAAHVAMRQPFAAAGRERPGLPGALEKGAGIALKVA